MSNHLLQGSRFLGWVMAVGSLGLSASVQAVNTNQIASISPASATQGTNGLVVVFTLSTTPPWPPPSNIQVSSVTLGTNAATAYARPNTNGVTNVVYATFNLPGQEAVGAKDVLIRYTGPNVVSFKANGFSVVAATSLAAGFAATPTNGVPPLTVNFTEASVSTVTNRLWDFGDGSTSADVNPVHTYYNTGSFDVSLTVWGPLGSNKLVRAGFITASAPPTNGAYVVVDTGQTNCYNGTGVTAPPAVGQPYYGQDAQFAGRQPAYRNNGDGTVSDLNTGLMWVQARGEASAWSYAVANAANCRVGGYTDWRMPTIKELYSLVEFTGANGVGFTSTAGYIPFIDTNYFGFAYGPGTSSEVGSRVIDAQDWSANAYVSTVMGGQAAVFGYNFTDGRIKGYPPGNSNYVRYVRGNTAYAQNKFVNNGDGTISDKATSLMWTRNDSGVGLNWSNALAWAQAQNAANYLGHNDWRLPNAKELQTLVDYSRSPDTTASAAINAVFNCTAITNEAGQGDYPWYWSSTALSVSPFKAEGVYVCFGRAMAYMNSAWVDAHGAGAQRSDPHSGSLSDYTYVTNGYYSPLAPQGDAIRLYNYVRLVRDIPATKAWRFAFVGDTHEPLTNTTAEIAAAALNDDVKLLIVAGDIVESGAGCSLATFSTQLASWRNALAPLAASGIPVYVVRGNHEDDVANGLTVWSNFFGGSYSMPTNGPSGEVGLTYSFGCSNALFVGLDDYVNIHRVNQSWLSQRLATNTRPHLFVFGHEPAFKAFHTDCLDDYPAERNAFWSSLAANGAKVYLCGHDHFLNVARVDDGDGNAANDLYQFIVGTGGTTNWPVNRYNYNGTNSPYTPMNVASVTNNYGYLLVEISGPDANDLGVTMTWKQRTYDTNTAAYLYVATSNTFAFTAVNRYQDSVGDGIPDWWRAQYFGGSGTSTNAVTCATSDPDHDGLDNYHEYLADTNPTNAASRVAFIGNGVSGGDVALTWAGGTNAWQYLQASPNLAANQWSTVYTNAPMTTATNTLLLNGAVSNASKMFYRLKVGRQP